MLNRAFVSKERRRLKKAISEAIRKKAKRSHLRKELIDLNKEWFYQTGGLNRLIYRSRFRRKAIKAFNAPNPIFFYIRTKGQND